VPCLTLRESTERPVTIDLGTNRLIGADPESAVRAAEAVLSEQIAVRSHPPLWDGHAADRIIDILRGLDWSANHGPA